MIIATVTAIMIIMHGVGFSFDVFHQAAKDTLNDPVRVAQIEAITEKADATKKALFKDIKRVSKTLAKMNKRDDLTRQEVLDELALVDVRSKMYMETFITLRFQAKERLSREEWEAMYKAVDASK